MNFTKHVIPIIVIPIVLVSFLLYGKFSESYKQASLEKNITKFIQIKGMDELVITEITGNENYSDSACTKYISTFGIGCVGRGSVNVVFDAHYKYYVSNSRSLIYDKNHMVEIMWQTSALPVQSIG